MARTSDVGVPAAGAARRTASPSDADAHVHEEVVCLPHRLGDALRPGEVVAKNSHGQSFQG